MYISTGVHYEPTGENKMKFLHNSLGFPLLEIQLQCTAAIDKPATSLQERFGYSDVASSACSMK